MLIKNIDVLFSNPFMYDEEIIKSRKKLTTMVSKYLAGDTSYKLPLVRFAVVDGSFSDLLCRRESCITELLNGEVQASPS